MSNRLKSSAELNAAAEAGCMSQLAGTHERAVVIPIRQSPVRTSVRFPMQLALTIHTQFGYFHGITENISATGLLFVCAFLPESLGAIEFTMAMPAEILGTATDVCIHCMGRVIRREPGYEQVKAAVVIDEYFLKA